MKIGFQFSACLIMLILGSNSFSQKNGTLRSPGFPIDKKTCNSSFQTIFIGKENAGEKISGYLSSTIQNLKAKEVSLHLISTKESRGGFHYTFEQHFKGIKIFRSQIKVNTDKNGYIKSVFDHSFETDKTTGNSGYQEISFSDTEGTVKKENIYFPAEETLVPAVRHEIAKGDDFYEIIYDNYGKVIYRNDLLRYFSLLPPDSNVSGTVFLPDPLTTAGVVYGTPYTDNNDLDVNEINLQRAQVDFNADFDTSTSLFLLESPYIKITEHSSPVVQPVTSSSPDFSFTRNQNGFEDVNVFYHISTFHTYIRSLGFTNLLSFQLKADCHALNGQDNSNYNGSNPPRLNFGEGGVDDAEDADVIIHEYGHAISDDASPGSNYGTERNALDEALGDYFASSYSRSINPFKWENVFSWDGHNEFWNGRSSVSTDHYPEDRQNDSYEDADIWSSTMMEIWEDIGRENADAIQLQALYGYASGMSMTDAAQLVIQADSTLNNGVFYEAICTRFYNRGLVNSCKTGMKEIKSSDKVVQLFNSESFASGNDDAILHFAKPAEVTIQMFDVAGKSVFRKDFMCASDFRISGKNLAHGIYLLKVSSEIFSVNFKLARF